MDNQRRHVLIEEGGKGRIEIIATGELDESHFEAVEGFIRRQRARMDRAEREAVRLIREQ